jgi:octaprenyl-diphosphate synthase
MATRWASRSRSSTTSRLRRRHRRHRQEHGDDFRERKLTLPVIKAVAAADAGERAFWTRVIEKGDQRRATSTAPGLLARHGAMEATRAEALGWAAKARAALAPLPAHPIRDMLDDLADYVVARIS